MIALLLALQITPVAPIVKGTALPPPASEEAAVMAPVSAVLRALEKDDGAALLAVTMPEGALTVARTGPDGAIQHRTQRWSEVAAQLKPDGIAYEERLGTPAIEIDEGVAMVWAPYTSIADGKVSHCGFDHFDLVRTAAGWRVLNVTYSHRTTGCEAAR